MAPEPIEMIPQIQFYGQVLPDGIVPSAGVSQDESVAVDVTVTSVGEPYFSWDDQTESV